jgi:uncharacterized protein YjiS (DUF1127 family)
MSAISLDLTAIRSRRLPKWRKIRAALKEWAQRSRSRHELTSLDERHLRDVGLTRVDVQKESIKPFWQP